MSSRQEICDTLIGDHAYCSRCAKHFPTKDIVVWTSDHPQLELIWPKEARDKSKPETFTLEELRMRFRYPGGLIEGGAALLICRECSEGTEAGRIMLSRS